MLLSFPFPHFSISQMLMHIDGTRWYIFSSGTCPQFSLTSPPMGTYSCPGSNITYTCVLSSGATGVITVWSGSAFQCPPTNQIVLLQRSAGTLEAFTPVPCCRLFTVTTNVTSTCYTSVLTLPAVQDSGWDHCCVCRWYYWSCCGKWHYKDNHWVVHEIDYVL